MAEVLHTWIVSIISSAVFCAVIIAVTPKGRVYNALKLLCGLVMIFAILSPLADIDFDDYSKSLKKYSDRADELTASANEYEDKLNRTYIEDKCAAYILDKAESYGAHPNSVAVSADWSMDGYWYPVSADISCNCADELRNKLTASIEAELGIAKERQTWTNG